jgi:membrane associated rhomboid family serine protease
MPPRAREPALGKLRLPRVIIALVAVIALLSIAAAVSARNGAPLLAEGVLLVTVSVWRGEVWRLVTWSLCELGPVNLVFACLTLIWFGGALARTWGERHFLAFYFGMAAAAALLTCIVGRLWHVVGLIPHAGSWPVLDAMVMAWGLLYPARQLRLYGVLRVTGRHLVWITVGGTVLFALFYGAAPLVPHFAAELLVACWLGPLRKLPAWWKGRRQATLVARARAFDLHQWVEKDRRRRR